MHPPVWTSLASLTLAISLVALAASLVSLWFAWRNHLRAEEQDRRRRPRLEVDPLHSRILRSPLGRLYCFHMQVRNPSDTDNAISSVELRIVFEMPDGAELIARIRQIESGGFPKGLGDALEAPARIGAHDIATGWCVFELRAEVLGEKLIERLGVEVRDTHGQVSTIEPRIIQGEQ